MPASAEPSDTTGATVTINGGDLAMSAPGSAPLGSVSPGATATVALLGISVTDTRAGVLDWNTTASVTDFVGADDTHIIANANMSYDPATPLVTGVATVSGPTGAVTLDEPVIVETATAVIGNNTATWDAQLSVAVPTNALADIYTATLTHSVV